MHPNEALITRFYEAFAARDPEAMAACYHDDVRFSDEVFPDLRGPRAGAMWRMLCEAAEDLVVTFSDVEADDRTGAARWEAVYTFAATGRKVHNRIRARFRPVRGDAAVRSRPTADSRGWRAALRRRDRSRAGPYRIG